MEKSRKKWGSTNPFLRDGPLNIFFEAQYLKNGQSDFYEIFTVCGSHGGQSTVLTRGRWGFKFRGERGANWPKMALLTAGGSLSAAP